jgi:hypothetical protein
MNDRPVKLTLTILATLVVLLALGAIAKSSSPPHPVEPTHPTWGAPAKTEPQPATVSPASPIPPAEIEGQDRYYSTGQFREYEQQQQITRPAYQHLPYRTGRVRIDITNVTSDGRIVLTVTPLGPGVSPEPNMNGSSAASTTLALPTSPAMHAIPAEQQRPLRCTP